MAGSHVNRDLRFPFDEEEERTARLKERHQKVTQTTIHGSRLTIYD
jgi:hypothetical protein